VHLVDEGTDTGPIVAQGVVPVLPDDDAERLRLRILAMEHRVYPAALKAAVEGRLHVEGRKVRVEGPLDVLQWQQVPVDQSARPSVE
jgi:phosphoribosylglycinamide formyltransferase-1